MFTIIKLIFGFFSGGMLSDTSIRLILIGGLIVTVLGLGFYFRHEFEQWIANKAYQSELGYNQQVNQTQTDILKQTITEQQKAIQERDAQIQDLQNKFSSINNNIKNNAKKDVTPVGPNTQQTIDSLRNILPSDTKPDTKPAPKSDTVGANPSIEAWKNAPK